ncbi:MAG: ATP-binding protein [Lactobacillus sp.]|nr:ATP-binding protein [Lactobacillus sp.]
MSRHKYLIRVSLVTLFAILFYLLSIFVMNSVVQKQQEHYLQREAEDYQLVADDKSALENWQDKSGITVITSPMRQGAGFQTMARDLVSHSLISRENPFSKQTIDNKTYLAYGLYATVGNPIVFFVPKDNPWNFIPAAFWISTVIYFVALLFGLFYSTRRRKKMLTNLGTLVNNVHRIRHQGSPEPLILRMDNVLYPLSAEVNKLDEDVSHLNEKIAIRSESFKRLIDHLPMGVMLMDMDGNVQMLNESMRHLLQVEDAALPHPFIDDVKTYKLSQMIEHTIRYQHNHHGEVQLVQQPMRYVDANVIQVGQDGPRPQILVLLYDLTNIRRIEQMQLDFVGNVSHELKTPVTAIKGFAETMIQKTDMDPKDRAEFIKIIYKESTRLNQLIQDILELSKLDETRKDEPVNVTVKPVVADILQELKPDIAARHLEVSVNGKEDVALKIDPVQFRQIMKNLITNAIFYNRDAGKIAVNFANGKNNVHISVVDTGIGLKEEEQSRIFERFYRVDKARSYNNGGTGLGLSIVSGIVNNYGGKLSVTSQYGVGSTFNLKLPKA